MVAADEAQILCNMIAGSAAYAGYASSRVPGPRRRGLQARLGGDRRRRTGDRRRSPRARPRARHRRGVLASRSTAARWPALRSAVAYAVNKPLGCCPRRSDTHVARPWSRLSADETRRLYPVGRLDADATGLILLTNDGELAQPLDPPALRGSEDLPCPRRRGAGGGARIARPCARRRAGGRADRPRRRAPVGPGRDRDDDPRGSKPPGAAYVRGVGHPVRALERVASARWSSVSSLAPPAAREPAPAAARRSGGSRAIHAARRRSVEEALACEVGRE